MKKYKLLLLLLITMDLAAQEDIISSPKVNADSSVTFRLYAPQAKKVRLQSDCLLNKTDDSWFGGKTKKQTMHLNENNVWELTTKPLKPEVYQYRFIVDGKKQHDPQNPDSAYVLLHQESIVAVNGDEQSDLYTTKQDIPHGRIDTLDYFDTVQQVTRKLLVYVPPYLTPDSDSGLTSILYLLHGISGDERSWIESGRACQILDNLLAKDLIKPLLVVMPDCNVKNKLTPKHRTNLFRNMLAYPILQHGDFEKAFPRMNDFVCKQYNISQESNMHYIAGLSSGAKQAANIVRDNPKMFSIVGLFSPAMMHKKQLPPKGNNMNYHIYVGHNDLFLKDGLRFAKQLNSRSVSCICHELQEGHTYRAWRQFLINFLTVIFEPNNTKTDLNQQ